MTMPATSIGDGRRGHQHNDLSDALQRAIAAATQLSSSLALGHDDDGGRGLLVPPTSSNTATTTSSSVSTGGNGPNVSIVDPQSLLQRRPHPSLPAVIPINVGGEVLSIAAATLAARAPASSLYAMLVRLYANRIGQIDQKQQLSQPAVDHPKQSVATKEDGTTDSHTTATTTTVNDNICTDDRGNLYLDNDPRVIRYLFNRLRGYHTSLPIARVCHGDLYEALVADAAMLGLSFLLEKEGGDGGSDSGDDDTETESNIDGGAGECSSGDGADTGSDQKEAVAANRKARKKRIRIEGVPSPALPTTHSSQITEQPLLSVHHHHHSGSSQPVRFTPSAIATDGRRVSSRIVVGAVGDIMVASKGGRHEMSFLVEDAEAVGIGVICAHPPDDNSDSDTEGDAERPAVDDQYGTGANGARTRRGKRRNSTAVTRMSKAFPITAAASKAATITDFTEDYGDQLCCACCYSNGKVSHRFPSYASETALMRYGVGCVVTVVVDFDNDRIHWEVGGVGAIPFAPPPATVVGSSGSGSGSSSSSSSSVANNLMNALNTAQQQSAATHLPHTVGNTFAALAAGSSGGGAGGMNSVLGSSTLPPTLNGAVGHWNPNINNTIMQAAAAASGAAAAAGGGGGMPVVMPPLPPPGVGGGYGGSNGSGFYSPTSTSSAVINTPTAFGSTTVTTNPHAQTILGRTVAIASMAMCRPRGLRFAAALQGCSAVSVAKRPTPETILQFSNASLTSGAAGGSGVGGIAAFGPDGVHNASRNTINSHLTYHQQVLGNTATAMVAVPPLPTNVGGGLSAFANNTVGGLTVTSGGGNGTVGTGGGPLQQPSEAYLATPQGRFAREMWGQFMTNNNNANPTTAGGGVGGNGPRL